MVGIFEVCKFTFCEAWMGFHFEDVPPWALMLCYLTLSHISLDRFYKSENIMATFKKLDSPKFIVAAFCLSRLSSAEWLRF
jgi:hypothetical protein